MKIIKLGVTLLVVFLLVTGCSLVSRLKEKLAKKDEDKKENVKTADEKEKTATSNEDDLKFYNAYIEVINKISSAAEDLQKDYISEVPDTKTLRKNSFVMVVSSSLQVNSLESVIKQYNRSFYDNGDLAKLRADNEDMKKEVEGNFKATLTALEDYHKTAQKVIDYYKNKEYQNDLSLASGYDEEMKGAYNKYKDAFGRLNSSLKKYKPKRNQRNPDDYSNPDEKAVAILLNTYENSLERAEEFYGRFEKFKRGDDTQPMIQSVHDVETGFAEDREKVLSAPFTDKTKYMKYSFEDYFSKTVNEFVNESMKFLKQAGNKTGEKEFNDGYNNVVRYYNYMINAYNTSISTVNTFRVY